MSEGTANKTASLSQAPGLMLTSWAGRKSRRPIKASPWKAQSQPVKSTLRYHQAATFQLDPCRISSEKVHVCSSLDGSLHIPYAVNVGLSQSDSLSAPCPPPQRLQSPNPRCPLLCTVACQVWGLQNAASIQLSPQF